MTMASAKGEVARLLFQRFLKEKLDSTSWRIPERQRTLVVGLETGFENSGTGNQLSLGGVVICAPD